MSDKILVTRSSMPPMEEYIEEIKEIWDSRWLTNMGSKHSQLETDLAEFLDICKDNITLFVNGHQALECIIEAMELGREYSSAGKLKNEVITTPFTFASTTHAIVRKGLKPVFCDIKEDDYTLDPAKMESLITDRTCAIVPVHVYGNLCDVNAIKDIADRHRLRVIYDAAHAFGVSKKGISAAKFGDASMFSFHATKVFNTIEGGAVCFKDGSIKTLLNQWKNFGITGVESVEYVGGNAKMNEFAAAMGICNLRHLKCEIEKRKNAVTEYRKRLFGIDGVKLTPIQDGVEQNYAYFPVVFDEKVFGASRDEVCDALAKQNIFARKYFYPITNTFDCYKCKYDSSLTPIALRISKQVLTLPLYADLSLEDVNRICDIIISCGK